MSQKYDVFISYSSRDRVMAKELANRLREAGFSPFFDRWCLPGGIPWGPRLEQSIQESASCTVLIGKEGFGPWQAREMWAALDRQGRDPAFPVIPTLLPGAEEVPSLFLGLNTWVDMRWGVGDEAAFQMLLQAIRGEAMGGPVFEELAEVVRPYLGLRAFREEDSAFFFGREAFTERLVGTVERTPFLAVVGPSGSGKSSVVQAGLIPALRQGALAGSGTWEFAVFRPGKSPLRQMAAPLVPMLEPEMDEITRLAKIEELAGYFGREEGRVSLGNTVRRILKKQPGTERLVLVADQFEELFTYKESEPEREVFLGHLLAATGERDEPLTVILTLRADFYSHCLGHRPLADRLEGRVVNIGPMTEGELHRAIEEPARSVGVRFEAGLVERILEDVSGEPGALPLLEFALTELWEGRRGELLTHEAYEEFGGIGGAIAQRAEKEYGRFSEEEKEFARRVFLNLVIPGEETEDVRRRAVLAEILPGEPARAGKVREVVKALADARLITTGWEEASGQETVEVAHEALIRGWERLKGWVQEDRAFLEWLKDLRVDLARWKESRELLRGKPLADALDWLRKSGEDLSTEARRFIQASARHERQRKALTVAAIAVAFVFLSLAALVASSAALFAWQRGNEAMSHRATSEAERNIASSRELAAMAIGQLKVDPERSLLLAMEAVKKAHTFESEDALRRAIQAPYLRAILRGHNYYVSSASFSPDGQLVVTASEDGTARLWEVETGKEITVLSGHEGEVHLASFNPKGQLVVTASEDGTARLWEVETGEEIAVLRGHEGEVSSASFSPVGRLVVTTSEDGTARLWEVETGEEIAVLRGHEGEVSSASFSPDGRLVVTASEDGTARLWEVETGKEVIVLPEDGVRSAAFSPDGQLMITVSLVATYIGDGVTWVEAAARLWEVNTGKEIAALCEGAARAPSAVFSPDGQLVVTTGWGGGTTPRLWEVGTGKEIAVLHGHESEVHSASFSPDGRLVVTASQDGTARLWKVETGEEIAILRGHEDMAWSASFSPDGQLVVTIGGNFGVFNVEGGSVVRLWEVEAGKEIAVLRGHEDGIWSAAFSPDGRLVVTTSRDKTARLWEAETGKEIACLRGHEHEVVSAIFSPDGRLVATIGGESASAPWTVEATVRLWEVETGKEIIVLHGRSASFSPDWRLVVTTGSDDTARLWEVETGREIAILRGSEDWVRSASFSPDGKLVVTRGGAVPWSGRDTTARLWEVETGKEIATLRGHLAAFSPDGRLVVTVSESAAQLWEAETGKEVAVLREHKSWVNGAAFSPDGRLVATAGTDGTARLWDTKTGREVAVLRGHRFGVDMAAFSPDGRLVVTVSSGPRRRGNGIAPLEWEMRLWRAETGEEIAVLYEHEDHPLSAHFSPDGQLMVTTSRDDAARLWDTKTGREIAVIRGHEGPIYKASFSPDGRLVVTTGTDDTARIHAAHIEDLLALAQKRVPREFTCQERVWYLHEDLDCGVGE
jgi:WD40 repeat protein/energy-coupling factor transporter ATP-binding protein EcfA2